MIVTCPSCAARFSVPDDAIGPAGRALRCGACRHKWFEGPVTAEEPAAPAAEAAAPPPEAASEEAGDSTSDFDKLFEAGDEPDDAVATAEDDGADLADAAPEDDDSAPAPEEPSPEPEPEAEPEPEGTPQAPVLSAAAAIRTSQRTSSWPAWTAVVSVVIVVVAATALLADVMVELWPPSKRLYAMVGLPFAGPGEGLEMHNISARFEIAEDGTRLVIEGDIVNASQEVKPAPTVRVVLRDAADHDVASWRFPASETNMIPSETVSFRTSYDRPPASAAGAALGFTSGAATTVAMPERAAARE